MNAGRPAPVTFGRRVPGGPRPAPYRRPRDRSAIRAVKAVATGLLVTARAWCDGAGRWGSARRSTLKLQATRSRIGHCAPPAAPATGRIKASALRVWSHLAACMKAGATLGRLLSSATLSLAAAALAPARALWPAILRGTRASLSTRGDRRAIGSHFATGLRAFGMAGVPAHPGRPRARPEDPAIRSPGPSLRRPRHQLARLTSVARWVLGTSPTTAPEGVAASGAPAAETGGHSLRTNVANGYADASRGASVTSVHREPAAIKPAWPTAAATRAAVRSWSALAGNLIWACLNASLASLSALRRKPSAAGAIPRTSALGSVATARAEQTQAKGWGWAYFAACIAASTTTLATLMVFGGSNHALAGSSVFDWITIFTAAPVLGYVFLLPAFGLTSIGAAIDIPRGERDVAVGALLGSPVLVWGLAQGMLPTATDFAFLLGGLAAGFTFWAAQGYPGPAPRFAPLARRAFARLKTDNS